MKKRNNSMIFQTIGFIALLIFAVSAGSIFQQAYVPNVNWFHQRYGPDNCGFLYHCYTLNTTVTSVRDYDIQCSNFWGTQSTCPREIVSMNLNATIKDAYQYDPSYSVTSWTVNCHYYHSGDTISFREQLDYHPLYNTTHVNWSLVGSPC